MSRGSIALVCALLAGCVSAIPVPTERDAEVGARMYPGLTLEELNRGRQLYISKCASCHTLFLPADRAPAQWPGLVEQMSERASLTLQSRAAIERYLTTAASNGQ